jgi:hypothetical protein
MLGKHIDEQSSRVSSFGGKLAAKQFGTFLTASVLLIHGDRTEQRPSLTAKQKTYPAVPLSDAVIDVSDRVDLLELHGP